MMTDATWITIISLAVTFLFMLGVPVLVIIAYWVIGCSFVLGLTLDNLGAELLNVFNKGFALLAMPLFILTGDLINRSGIARRLSDFAYACLGWVRGGLAMASLGACGCSPRFQVQTRQRRPLSARCCILKWSRAATTSDSRPQPQRLAEPWESSSLPRSSSSSTGSS